MILYDIECLIFCIYRTRGYHPQQYFQPELLAAKNRVVVMNPHSCRTCLGWWWLTRYLAEIARICVA
jgi:hypothetical protein